MDINIYGSILTTHSIKKGIHKGCSNYKEFEFYIIKLQNRLRHRFRITICNYNTFFARMNICINLARNMYVPTFETVLIEE